MLLVVKDLEAGYGRTRALNGVSLEIPANQVSAVIGANGAGKTTLLSCISGLMKPWSGDIIFDGRSISSKPPHAVVRAGLVHVPQGRRLFGDLTVRENLMLGAYLARNQEEIQGTLEEMLAWFPILGSRANQKAGTLSGGEQQMLAIARALMSRPKLVMLDEPTLGLAPMMVDTVIEIIRGMVERGITVLVAEQDAHMAMDVADKVWVMDMGEIALSGSPEELRASPLVQEAYLGL